MNNSPHFGVSGPHVHAVEDPVTGDVKLTAYMRIEPLSFLENAGRLNEEQSRRFVECVLEQSWPYATAASCLYWWQRPFKRWLCRGDDPKIKRFKP